MDLVASVRKEGSRGGRGDFKWSDVKESSHRENYLGHSVMAPVGRWQQGKDLLWYSRNDSNDDEERAAREREEIKRVKDAEEEAMARALGLPIPSKGADAGTENANLTPLGGTDAQKAVKDDDSHGHGHERRRHRTSPGRDRERRKDRAGDRDRDSERVRRHRRHRDDRDRDRDHRRSYRHRSRSASRDREHRRRRSRSRSKDRRGYDDEHRRHRHGDHRHGDRSYRSHPRDREDHHRRH